MDIEQAKAKVSETIRETMNQFHGTDKLAIMFAALDAIPEDISTYHHLQDVADRFGISKVSVFKWVKSGYLKAYPHNGALCVSEREVKRIKRIRNAKRK